jgi:hypothetical protein
VVRPLIILYVAFFDTQHDFRMHERHKKSAKALNSLIQVLKFSFSLANCFPQCVRDRWN